MSFFGVQIHPSIAHAQHNCGHMLQGTVDLQYLELLFDCLYDLRANDNPWSKFHKNNHKSQWFNQDANYRNMASKPCQKILVDCIMTFAFPYIKAIPNVYLAGAVKRTIKEKWHHIFECEYRERKEDFRTHGHNHSHELAHILGRPAYAYVKVGSRSIRCANVHIGRHCASVLRHAQLLLVVSGHSITTMNVSHPLLHRPGLLHQSHPQNQSLRSFALVSYGHTSARWDSEDVPLIKQ